MAILIVGGAGFIGSHLVDYYLNLGKKVTVIDNLSTGKLENIRNHLENRNFKFFQANILNYPDLGEYLDGCELVYDLAAMVGMFNVLEQPITTLHVNINITQRLLEAIAQLDKKPKIVVASSSEVYGSRPTSLKEMDHLLIEDTSKAHASYPISKLCNEVAAMAYFKQKQVPAIVVRIFNTVGPRQSARYGMVLPRFIKQALTNQPITIFSDGKQRRAFCDVRDMCSMLHQLTQTPKSIGEIINVGSEKSISILKLAEEVKKLIKSKSDFIFQSHQEVYGEDYINIQKRKPNLDKLKSIIDYKLHWSLKETIKESIKAMKG